MTIRRARAWAMPAALAVAACVLVFGRMWMSARDSLAVGADAASLRAEGSEAARGYTDGARSDHPSSPFARCAWAPTPAPTRLGGVPFDSRRPRPLGRALGAALVALFGCGAWVGATVLLIRRALEKNPEPNRAENGERDRERARAPHAPARPGIDLGQALLSVALVVGFALFVLGLRLA